MKIYKSNGEINSLFFPSLSESLSLPLSFFRSVCWRRMFWHFELFQFRIISIKYFAMRILLMFNVWSMDSLTTRFYIIIFVVLWLIWIRYFVSAIKFHLTENWNALSLWFEVKCSCCDYAIWCHHSFVLNTYCEKEAGQGNSNCKWMH